MVVDALLARSVVGMLPNVISVVAVTVQYDFRPRYSISLPAVLDTLTFMLLAVAINVLLLKLKLFERKKPLSNTGSQSPKWFVMKTIVPSAIQAACVVSKTSESLKVIATEVLEQSTVTMEAICSRTIVGYFIVWVTLTVAEVVRLDP